MGDMLKVSVSPFLFIDLTHLKQRDACGHGGIQAVKIIAQWDVEQIVAILRDVRAHPLGFISNN